MYNAPYGMWLLRQNQSWTLMLVIGAVNRTFEGRSIPHAQCLVSRARNSTPNVRCHRNSIDYVPVTLQHHQGKGNKLLFPDAGNKTKRRGHAVECHQRLGGLLRFYARAA
jgi:hypothetical protein